jgi:hypothetical protein
MRRMKYIKKQKVWYDNLPEKTYYKGAYVLINAKTNKICTYARVIKAELGSYEVQTIKNGKLYNFWINHYHINRRLNMEEIETYNALVDSTKYNL